MHGAVDEVQVWIRSSYASMNHFSRQAVVSSLGTIVDPAVPYLCPTTADPGRIRWYRPEPVSRCPTLATVTAETRFRPLPLSINK
jgi:hypothetical protein